MNIRYMCGGGAPETRNWVLGHMELELQVIMSCLTWTLGTELGSSRKAYTFLTTESSFQALTNSFYVYRLLEK